MIDGKGTEEEGPGQTQQDVLQPRACKEVVLSPGCSPPHCPHPKPHHLTHLGHGGRTPAGTPRRMSLGCSCKERDGGHCACCQHTPPGSCLHAARAALAALGIEVGLAAPTLCVLPV